MQNQSIFLKLSVILVALAVMVSVACSAKTKLRAPVSKNSQIKNETDCLSLGKWDERESCFSRHDDFEINNCERTSPHACKPYKEMYFAEQKIILIETETHKVSSVVYKKYLTEDPDYIKDFEAFLRDSSKLWALYRDAQCQLEPYVSGMSRREFENIIEQCRLEQTKNRIVELERMLTTVKSNQGYSNGQIK